VSFAPEPPVTSRAHPIYCNKSNKTYGIKPGETTPDGQFSLLTARCVGPAVWHPLPFLMAKCWATRSPEKTMAFLAEVE
jgi:NADH:ubiquinone oxidoreductase subunit E